MTVPCYNAEIMKFGFVAALAIVLLLAVPSDAKKVPNEVADLLVEIGGGMCDKLGALVQRPRFDAKKRCDLFKETLEGMAGMSDAMINEMDMTQQDFVNIAVKPSNLMQLSVNMKKLTKYVLQKKKPSEADIEGELSKVMGQWILNVGTNQGSQNGMDQLPREALKGLRAMGIAVPTYGTQDDDEMDEENLLMPDDYAWAQAKNNEDDDADESGEL